MQLVQAEVIDHPSSKGNWHPVFWYSCVFAYPYTQNYSHMLELCDELWNEWPASNRHQNRKPCPRVLEINIHVLESLIGERISSCKFSKGSKNGDNIAGNIQAVRIRTASGRDRSLIMKFIPDYNIDILSYLVHCRIMEIENEFYSSMTSEMRDILRVHRMDPDEALPFPKHYGGNDLYVALEDLRTKGFRMADKFRGLDFQQVQLVMSSLGKFHALSYAYIRTQGEKVFQTNAIRSKLLHFPWKPEGMDPIYYKEAINMFTPAVDILMNQNKELGTKLERLTAEFYDLLPGIFNKTDTEYFPVICHGDLWVNNVLFSFEDNVPTGVRFLDLQQVHRGNIFEDLVHFLITSTTPEMRKVNLFKWLEHYYISFVTLLQQLQCPQPSEFSLEFLVENYYKNLRPFAVFVGGSVAFHLGGFGESDEEGQGTDERPDTSQSLWAQSHFHLTRYESHELTPLGAHYQALREYCTASILGEPRALKTFVDIMDEFDKLGVFD